MDRLALSDAMWERVTQLEDVQGTAQADWLSNLAPDARVAVQTSNHEAAVSAVIHGGGLACLARFRADGEPGLVRLAASPAAPSAGIWLVVHRDNRHMHRIRVVLTHITEGVQQLAARLLPVDAGAKASGDGLPPSGEGQVEDSTGLLS